MKRIKIKNKKRFFIFLSVSLCLLVAIVLLIIHGNTAINVEEIDIRSEKIPTEFSGYRIAHVSDLHNAEFGKDNERLLSLIEDAEPDIIVITGDIIDSRNPDASVASGFINRAARIAPCYYVSGNHEKRIPEEYEKFLSEIESENVYILADESVTLEREGAEISLIGMDDYAIDDSNFLPMLNSICGEEEGYKIVLSHRPDFYNEYAEAGADLVFCGHAHGGQFVLPFVGGVLAPGQGFLPEYTDGLYNIENTDMIVSRGLGNSLFPFRINNYPQLIIAELSDGK